MNITFIFLYFLTKVTQFTQYLFYLIIYPAALPTSAIENNSLAPQFWEVLLQPRIWFSVQNPWGRRICSLGLTAPQGQGGSIYWSVQPGTGYTQARCNVPRLSYCHNKCSDSTCYRLRLPGLSGKHLSNKWLHFSVVGRECRHSHHNPGPWLSTLQSHQIPEAGLDPWLTQMDSSHGQATSAP